MTDQPDRDPDEIVGEGHVDAGAVFADYIDGLCGGTGEGVDELCVRYPHLEEELRALHGDWANLLFGGPQAGGSREPVSIARETNRGNDASVGPRSMSGSFDELVQRIRNRGTQPRYTFQGIIARGGMGVIHRVFDEDLNRPLAMKVILGQGEPFKGLTPVVDDRTLGRFLDEAQVTGQLDHPGIVPVHELGVDQSGQVFFTMKLVKGRTFGDFLEDEKAQQGDTITWPRAVRIIQRVCEAMSYAHSKNVIHRDLKPANVMVGRFGEVFVMDWGLARILGVDDPHDIRIREEQAPSAPILSARRDEEMTPDSPLVTMDGDVVGTPAYMPPEQARGQVEALGPRSDVYAVGAMLYHALARRAPYIAPGDRVSPRTVLAMVLAGPPAPLAGLAPSAPPELIAIAEKAMCRDAAGRYLTMGDLAVDLQAFLENRVVKAHRTGPAIELRKWVQRNRGLAATTIAALVLVFSIGAAALVSVRNDRDLAQEKAREAAASLIARDHAAKESAKQAASAEAARISAAIESANARHQFGLALVERAKASEAERRPFEACLAAARALGFEGMGGPFDGHPRYLAKGSPEEAVARSVAWSNGVMPVWQKRGGEFGEVIQLSVSPDGGKLVAAYETSLAWWRLDSGELGGWWSRLDEVNASSAAIGIHGDEVLGAYPTDAGVAILTMSDSRVRRVDLGLSRRAKYTAVSSDLSLVAIAEIDSGDILLLDWRESASPSNPRRAPAVSGAVVRFISFVPDSDTLLVVRDYERDAQETDKQRRQGLRFDWLEFDGSGAAFVPTSMSVGNSHVVGEVVSDATKRNVGLLVGSGSGGPQRIMVIDSKERTVSNGAPAQDVGGLLALATEEENDPIIMAMCRPPSVPGGQGVGKVGRWVCFRLAADGSRSDELLSGSLDGEWINPTSVALVNSQVAALAYHGDVVMSDAEAGPPTWSQVRWSGLAFVDESMVVVATEDGVILFDGASGDVVGRHAVGLDRVVAVSPENAVVWDSRGKVDLKTGARVNAELLNSESIVGVIRDSVLIVHDESARTLRLRAEVAPNASFRGVVGLDDASDVVWAQQSSNGLFLYVGSDPGGVSRVNLRSGAREAVASDLSYGPVLSGNGAVVALRCVDGWCVRNVDTGAEVAIQSAATGAALSPDGSLIAMPIFDGSKSVLELWEVAANRLLGRLDMPRLPGDFASYQLAFHPSGRSLLFRSAVGGHVSDAISLIDLGVFQRSESVGTRATVRSASLRPNSCDWCWVDSGGQVFQATEAPRCCRTGVDIGVDMGRPALARIRPGGSVIAQVDRDSRLRIVDWDGGRVTVGPRVTGEVRHVEWSSNGQWLAVFQDISVDVLEYDGDARTLSQPRRYDIDARGSRGLAVSDDGRYALGIVPGGDAPLRVWSLVKEEVLAVAGTCAAFVSGGAEVLVGDDRGIVRVLDIASGAAGKSAIQLGTEGRVVDIAISGDFFAVILSKPGHLERGRPDTKSDLEVVVGSIHTGQASSHIPCRYVGGPSVEARESLLRIASDGESVVAYGTWYSTATGGSAECFPRYAEGKDAVFRPGLGWRTLWVDDDEAQVHLNTWYVDGGAVRMTGSPSGLVRYMGDSSDMLVRRGDSRGQSLVADHGINGLIEIANEFRVAVHDDGLGFSTLSLRGSVRVFDVRYDVRRPELVWEGRSSIPIDGHLTFTSPNKRVAVVFERAGYVSEVITPARSWLRDGLVSAAGRVGETWTCFFDSDADAWCFSRVVDDNSRPDEMLWYEPSMPRAPRVGGGSRVPWFSVLGLAGVSTTTVSAEDRYDSHGLFDLDSGREQACIRVPWASSAIYDRSIGSDGTLRYVAADSLDQGVRVYRVAAPRFSESVLRSLQFNGLDAEHVPVRRNIYSGF